MDRHSQKRKKNYIKEKSCYSDQFFDTVDQTPPKQHQKLNNFKSDTSKKEIVLKRHHRPDQGLDFYPEESLHSQNNIFNSYCQTQTVKDRPWVFTLQI